MLLSKNWGILLHPLQLHEYLLEKKYKKICFIKIAFDIRSLLLLLLLLLLHTWYSVELPIYVPAITMFLIGSVF